MANAFKRLTSNSVIALRLESNQDLWIGTYGGGLARLRGGYDWTIYNVINSFLPKINVESLEIDPLGNKWLSVQDNGLTVFREGGVVLTGVDANGQTSYPKGFFLLQNYPNPFNPTTVVSY